MADSFFTSPYPLCFAGFFPHGFAEELNMQPVLSNFARKIFPLCFFALGWLCLGRAHALGLGSAAVPGPGLWPLLVGAGLLLCGLSLGLREWRAVPGTFAAAAPSRKAWLQAGAVAVACVLWIFLLQPAGWVLASTVALGVASGAAGNGLRQSLWLIALFLIVLWLGLDVLLHWPLPRGQW